MQQIEEIVADLRKNNANPRLVVTDLDGTLLDDSGSIPPDFWDIHPELVKRNILFSPASGRQYARIRQLFAPIADDTVFIAENGAYVVENNQGLSSHYLADDYIRSVINTVRKDAATVDLGLVICGRDTAFVELSNKRFVSEITKYYASLAIVDDLLQVSEPIIKIAMYSPSNFMEELAEKLTQLSADYQVVISGTNWLDIMRSTINKGEAVAEIQAKHGISKEEVFVFGDYLNDLEMLENAHYSFAPANANPLILDKVKYILPANSEHGVTNFLKAFFTN